MAAKNCVICPMAAMDRLWFHQIILFSEPSLFHPAEDPRKRADYSSKNSSQMSVTPDQEISPPASAITCPQDETSSQESELVKETTRPTRLNPVPGKTRSHSSSPISAQRKSRNRRYSAGRLQKSMSCKSLVELELEEVKGFMDLGFIFRKEDLSKRIINLIPGLQRIGSYKNDKTGTREYSSALKNNNNNNDVDDDEEKKGTRMRPYLSEAWILKKPDSPLLNLRIPRVSTAADMKKHLKYWAQTVASAIQQES